MTDTSENPLLKFCAPRDAGAAFLATHEGSFAMIEPLTPRAESWLRANVDAEATWMGKALVVEFRYFPDLVDAIIDAGFLFERDAFPN
ncbi:hypothetical protein [Sphingomonas corticis]|uniref:Uncharacterized protein n=1 Tax=Sphingomonas corticis TaxID=2722791 RepID=A0ABX1CMY3_9SPHN|nr:hypothetical protein [Sphingomonas corticis]NJR79334.1 hypothetical protein [Sphingomonas corticis]